MGNNLRFNYYRQRFWQVFQRDYMQDAQCSTPLIIEKQVGGQIINTAEVVNYPGVQNFRSGTNGSDAMYANKILVYHLLQMKLKG